MLNKVLLFLAFCFTVFSICFLLYKQHEIASRQSAIENQVVLSKDLLDNIVRSSSQYASKEDIENISKLYDVNIKTIKSDLDKVGGKIDAINIVVTSSYAQKKSNIPSTGTVKNDSKKEEVQVECNGAYIKCPNPDKYGYLDSGQVLDLNESFGDTNVPFGSVKFSAWEERPWSIDIYNRDYVSAVVVGKDEDERIYAYNKSSIVVNDKTFDLKIKSSTLKQEHPSYSFKYWNPRLYIGYDVGANLYNLSGVSNAPNINLQLMSYGRYNRSPEISFLQLGLGVEFMSRSLVGVVSPFQYNIGNKIPFMSNLYIGPSIYVGTNKDIMLMGGLRVGL